MYEIVETIDGRWMVLLNGFQIGDPPFDRSGCSSTTFATREIAEEYLEQEMEIDLRGVFSYD